MKFLELLRVALEGIWANKLRSALTMLGIIIGVLAVIIIVTIAQGGQAQIMGEMESYGSNLFGVWVGQAENGDYERYLMDSDDCRAIKAAVPDIRYLIPMQYYSDTIKSRRKKESCSITATEADIAVMQNIEMEQGRFFNSADNAVARRVIVINRKLADDMFGSGGDAVGQKLTMGQVSVTVIGVTKNKTSMFGGGGQRPQAYIPIKFYSTIEDFDGAWEIDGTAVSKDKVKETAKQVVRILQLRHGDKEKTVYQSATMEEQMQMANKIMSTLTLIIGAIAGISLLVGGIGIMNIMLVSVTERTREIGIRIAVGARKQDILIQFLIEAVVLSVIGGLIGLLLGLGGAAAICAALKLPVVISVKTIILAVLFSSAVGIFFGLYPANRAAKLDPIDSLRYE